MTYLEEVKKDKDFEILSESEQNIIIGYAHCIDDLDCAFANHECESGSETLTKILEEQKDTFKEFIFDFMRGSIHDMWLAFLDNHPEE